MIDVMLIGEPMVIFFPNEEGSLREQTQFTKGLAGAEVNVGIGLSRLGKTPTYLTKLSQDELGEYVRDVLEKEKLNLDYVIEDGTHPLGLMFKDKVSNGDPHTLYYRKGSAASTLSIEDVRQIDFSQIKLLHMTGIPPAISKEMRDTCFYLLEKAKKAGCYITFDPNLRPALWESEAVMKETLNAIATFANLMLPGVSEGQLLTGEKEVEAIADYYLNQGSECVVMKLGAEGAFVKEKNKTSQTIPGYKVEHIVDTVGAGDGFAVGIINGYLEGLSIAASVDDANAIGAIQIQHASDNEGLPTRQALDAFKSKVR